MNAAPTPAIPDFDSVVRRATRCSRYLQHLLESDADLLPWLREHYQQPCGVEEIAAWLDEIPAADEESLSRALRRLRKRVMLKLVARDLGGLADLDEVTGCMTALAELAIQRAQELVMQSLVAQYGQPHGAGSGKPQTLLVVGMGKLGGRELNVSSDIDLIFLYPEDGECDGARALSNHEFFAKLGRRLIGLIGELTGEGMVFRVDMRLRPYGDSGPLVMSFAALEEYLVEQGREWERYAWIKARVVSPADCPEANGHSKDAASENEAGGRSFEERPNETRHARFPHPTPPPMGEGANESLREFYVNELMQLAQPFIFRKYLDFGAVESMRKLHAQIRQEVQRRDRYNNIKLGPGGIREIEFIAQVFQLIRGGRDSGLRIRPTLNVLRVLRETGQISADDETGLKLAYVFLRNLEHRLQYLDDQQTQDLPENPGDQALLAEGMGYPDYRAMLAQLDRHRALVSEQFAKIFSTGESDEAGGAQLESPLWSDNMLAEEARDSLDELGYRDAANLAERLLQIRNSARYRQLPESSRQRMDKLVPQFISLCAVQPPQGGRRRVPNGPAVTLAQGNRDQALPRVLNLLESISRRASYLAFLAEYPQVLQPLASIASASEWACDYLIQHPILLDELLDAREIYLAPDWAALGAELQRQLDECGADTERQMDVLRQFQHSQIFRLLAMDLQELLPLEKLSDHLSDLADLILRHVLEFCWRDARARHRERPQSAGANSASSPLDSGLPAFGIIAYGKLGGRELGYASDLDLIFLFDDPHPDAAEIYAKLAKRINTLLSSHTAAGRLYEIDLRLRPNGASGLLVSTVPAFVEYQHRHAWAWEHQALTRARFCAGDAGVGERFEAIRREVLCLPRDKETLRREIVEMRQKMRDEHANKSSLFDIKHDSGGMVDIEFMVQFLVLAYSAAYPELTANSGNLALLKQAGALGLIDARQAEAVCAVYRHLRALQHKMRLNNQSPCRIDPEEMDTAPVLALWGTLLGEEPV